MKSKATAMINDKMINLEFGEDHCMDGACPAIYDCNSDYYIVQGYKLNNIENIYINENEDLVLIPKKLWEDSNAIIK